MSNGSATDLADPSGRASPTVRAPCSQLVNDWDKKMKGSVSKVEFMQGVKQSLKVKTDMKPLEALCATLRPRTGQR